MGKKISIVGDLHFGLKGTVPQFVGYQERELDKAVSYARDNSISDVVVLGDVLNDRRNVYVPTIELLLRKFREYADTGIRFFIVVGNHDTFYKNTNRLNTPSELFDGFDPDQFVIVDTEPLTVTMHGRSCLLVPWMAKDVHQEWTSLIETSPADYCFGHFEIDGFVMNNSNKCRSVLRGSSFDFRRTFSGHFHTRSSRGRILYVGSLCQLDWSDHGLDKGFHVLDAETDGVEFVRSDDVIFHKILIGKNFSFDSVKDLRDCFLKVYVNRKLSTKENGLLGELVTRNISYEIIDNTVLGDLADDDSVVESEDFKEIVTACIDSQEMSDADKEAVGSLINEYHAEMIQGRKQ